MIYIESKIFSNFYFSSLPIFAGSSWYHETIPLSILFCFSTSYWVAHSIILFTFRFSYCSLSLCLSKFFLFFTFYSSIYFFYRSNLSYLLSYMDLFESFWRNEHIYSVRFDLLFDLANPLRCCLFGWKSDSSSRYGIDYWLITENFMLLLFL